MQGHTPQPVEGSTGQPSDGFYFITLAAFAGLLVAVPLEGTTTAFGLAALGVASLAMVDLRAVLVLFYPIWGLMGALFSCALIENGAYITEQFRYGFNVGATASLGAYTVAFLGVAHFCVTRLLRGRSIDTRQLRDRSFYRIVVASTICTALFYAATFAVHGTGLQYPSRFQWIQSLSPTFGQFHGIIRSFVIPATFGLVGAHWTMFRAPRIWYLSLSAPIVAILLTGEKFTGFLVPLIIALAGAGLAAYLRGDTINVRPRQLFVATAVLAFLAMSVVEGFRRMGAVDVAGAIERRVALQGHVWFGILEKYGGNAAVPLTELLRPNTLDSPAGLDYLSYLISDTEFVRSRIADGLSFTMGGPPSALAAFGFPLGMAIYALLGILFGLIGRYTLTCLSRGATIRAAAGLSYLALVGVATQMGQWDAFYGSVGLACLALVILDSARANWRTRDASPPRQSLR